MTKRVAISMMKEISRELGYDIWIEPEYGFIGYLEKNGKRHFFRNTCLDINRAGATKVSNDKGYTSLLLGKFGYPVALGKTFLSERFNVLIGGKDGPDRGLEYLRTLGFPAIIKPNNASQGTGVRKIYSESEYWKAIEEEGYERYRIEKYYSGKDYRILVLAGVVMAAYERIPFTLVGDGVHTLAELLEKKKQLLKAEDRKISLNTNDGRISQNLGRSGLSDTSILPPGETVALLDNANLSTGGDMRDITDLLHPDFARLAVDATRDIGLTLCGVDIITGDATRAHDSSNPGIILEMNASPGLSHYHTHSKDSEARTRNIYRKILELLE